MEFDKDLRSIQEARDLAKAGGEAAKELSNYSEEQIDAIIKNMAIFGEEHAYELAEMAVEETGFGIVEDKVFKNHMGSGMMYNAIKDLKTQGVIKEDKANGTVEVYHGILNGLNMARHQIVN